MADSLRTGDGKSSGCAHTMDVSIACGVAPANWTYTTSETPAPPAPNTIALVDGVSGVYGRVEVFANGRWNTVCDDGWRDENTVRTSEWMVVWDVRFLICRRSAESIQPDSLRSQLSHSRTRSASYVARYDTWPSPLTSLAHKPFI